MLVHGQNTVLPNMLVVTHVCADETGSEIDKGSLFAESLLAACSITADYTVSTLT